MRKLLIIAMVLTFAVTADAQWFDDFDAYPSNTLLDGQGGWVSWAGYADVTSLASNDIAASPENSAKIMQGSDIVQEFAGVTSGQWEVTMLQYVPTASLNSGDSYFIMLNKYDGPNNDFNWSIQLKADTNNGLMVHDWPGPGTTKPLITNRWVELKLEIDLDIDLCRTWYDGQVLGVQQWTAAGGTNVQSAIEAIDLYSGQTEGNRPVYYDDMLLDVGSFQIPEPSIFLLGGLGLLALIRRKK